MINNLFFLEQKICINNIMNILIDLIFIFIYIVGLIIFNIINFDDNEFIFQKIILFLSISLFMTLLEFIKKTKTYYSKGIKQIIYDSFKIGLFSIIGLSIYNDLILMKKFEYNNSKSFFHNNFIIIPSIITITLIGINFISYIIKPNEIL